MPYSFVNPYNFIPLGKEKSVYVCQTSDQESTKKYSGAIQYTVMTKTPLLIPDSSVKYVETVDLDGKNKEKVEHPHKPFVSLDAAGKGSIAVNGKLPDNIARPEHPFIPGSEIRGMFRSVYEMLTDSCLSVLNEDIVLSKRTHEVFSAGLLKKVGEKQFDLYDAEDCIFRADESGSDKDAPPDHYRNNDRGIKEYCGYKTKSYKVERFNDGDCVFFDRIERGKAKSLAKNYQIPRGKAKSLAKNLSETKSGESKTKGYVLKGLAGPEMGIAKKEKHNCHIFCLTDESTCIHEGVNIEILKEVLGEYAKNGKNVYEDYSDALEQFFKADIDPDKDAYFPVYYSKPENTDLVFLSPAAITREVYPSEIGSKVKGFNPCKGEENLCPACALFGTINDNNKKSSRIRFSDLVIKDGTTLKYHKPVTLAPLAEPKINMEFYLERPDKNAVFWTYDYYIDSKWKIQKNKKGINGRKYYWHSSNILSSDEKTNLNSTVYPLDKGNYFTGYLYFDDISSQELNRLIFMLNCGEENDNIEDAEHGYKLGGGKPVGLGSIAVKVDNIKIRTFEKETYSVVPYNSYEKPFDDEDEKVKHFNTITSFNIVHNKKVDYPRTEEGGDIFKWFSENHKGYKNGKETNSPNKRTQEYYAQYLIPMSVELGTILRESKNQPEKKPTNTDKSNNELAVNKNYKAEIIGEYFSKTGVHYFNIKVNGNTSIDKKAFNIRADHASGKQIGDKVHVRYNGIVAGFPRFDVIN